MTEASFQLMSFAILTVVMLLPALAVIFAATIVAKAAKRLVRVFTR